MDILDSIDQQLIELVGENARQDSATLAKQLNVSAATVRRRLSRLIESDVLRIVGAVNPAKIGIPLLSMVALNVTHEKLESVLEALAERTEIRWASITTGRFDIVALGRFSSNDHLASFVAKELPQIGGIQHCEMFICLDTKKLRYTLIRPF